MSADWQTIRLTLEPKPSTGPSKAGLTGYDQVAPILGRKEYACFGCHTSEWPYLSRKGGWPRLMESLGDTARPTVTTKEELAAIIVGCMDLTTEDYCAGDPKNPSDTRDAKMPTKFGRKPVTDEDLAVLKRWVLDGAQELSVTADAGVDPSKVASYELPSDGSPSIETRISSNHTPTEPAFRSLVFEVRPRQGQCEPASLPIMLKGSDGNLLTKVAVQFNCDTSGLYIYKTTVQI